MSVAPHSSAYSNGTFQRKPPSAYMVAVELDQRVQDRDRVADPGDGPEALDVRLGAVAAQLLVAGARGWRRCRSARARSRSSGRSRPPTRRSARAGPSRRTSCRAARCWRSDSPNTRGSDTARDQKPQSASAPPDCVDERVADADRGADDEVGLDALLLEPLEAAGLVGAARGAAGEDERGLHRLRHVTRGQSRPRDCAARPPTAPSAAAAAFHCSGCAAPRAARCGRPRARRYQSTVASIVSSCGDGLPAQLALGLGAAVGPPLARRLHLEHARWASGRARASSACARRSASGPGEPAARAARRRTCARGRRRGGRTCSCGCRGCSARRACRARRPAGGPRATSRTSTTLKRAVARTPGCGRAGSGARCAVEPP